MNLCVCVCWCVWGWGWGWGGGGGHLKVATAHAQIPMSSIFLEYAYPDGIFQSRVRINRYYILAFFTNTNAKIPKK